MIIGTCSICAGPVDDSMTLCGAPKCRRCGALKKMSYGPIVDMEPCQPPAHPYSVPFEKFQPEQLPYYVKGTLPKPEPCNRKEPTEGQAGRIGVELFPFQDLPEFIEGLGRLTYPANNNPGFSASGGPVPQKPATARSGFVRTEPATDKYPFHGDLI